MASAAARPFGETVRDLFGQPFRVPATILVLFTVIIAYGHLTFPGGFQSDAGLRTLVLVGMLIWIAAWRGRTKLGAGGFAGAFEAVVMFLLLALLASFVTVVLARGDTPYIGPVLSRLDHALLPFFDWPAFMRTLPEYPRTFLVMNYVYGTLDEQPFAFLLLTVFIGGVRAQSTFLTAWALGLALCIMPFHFLPSRGAYVFYGVGPAEMPGLAFAMPFEFPALLEQIRNGTIDSISLAHVSGLVSMPSFHACGATILAMSWWQYRWLRWPMLALNVGMAIFAIPIGSHFVVDIIAGAACGLIAVKVSRWLHAEPHDPWVAAKAPAMVPAPA